MSDQNFTPAPEEKSLRDLLDILFRRRKTIVRTFLVVFILGAIYVSTGKAVYRSSAKLLVQQSSKSGLPQIEGLNPADFLSLSGGSSISTQIEILTSDRVIRRATELAGVKSGSVRVKAGQVNDTDVVTLTVESGTKQAAKRMAQALPEAYRDTLQDISKEGLSNAIKFVTDRMGEEALVFKQAESDLQKFMRNANVSDFTTEQGAKVQETLGQGTSIRQAEANLIGLQKTLQETISLRQATPQTIDTPTTASNTGEITTLKAQLATLKNQRAGLLQLYKPDHLQVKQVDAQIGDVEQRLKNTPAMVTTRSRTINPAILQYDERIAILRGQVASTSAQIEETRKQLSSGMAQVKGMSNLSQQYNKLVQNLEMSNVKLAGLTKTIEILTLREKSADVPVQTLEPARGESQVAPRYTRDLMVYALLALVVAGLLGVIVHTLDDRIHTPEDVSAILGASAIGYVPIIEKEEDRIIANLSKGGSLLETYRVLRSNVQFATIDLDKTTLLVTSTLPSEGKSMTACNLATAAAYAGMRVIIVDTDLRKPTLHTKFKRFNIERKPGVTNVLVGQVALDDALQPIPAVPGLRVLTTGPLPPNPAELLNSQAMKDLHAALRERADLVIFDTPPVLVAADAQIVSAEADGVIYVVNMGETRKSALRVATEVFQRSNTRIIGLVFNKVQMETRGYGYKKYGYGKGKYGYGKGGYGKEGYGYGGYGYGYGYGYKYGGGYGYYRNYSYTSSYQADQAELDETRKSMQDDLAALPLRHHSPELHRALAHKEPSAPTTPLSEGVAKLESPAENTEEKA